MKRFPKLIVTLLVLAMVIGIFTAIPVAAANEYDALRLKSTNITAGHYATAAMDGEIVQHCANKNYKEEITCLVDNNNGSGYWSKPYKFNALKDNGGTTIPVILIDAAALNDGNGIAVAAFDMRLRSGMDCRPLHVVLQATTAADSNNWVPLADKRFTDADWDASPKTRIEFPETTVYKVRLLVYDIGEANPAEDDYNDYVVCKGDETRFTLSEIDLLKVKEGSSGSTGGSSTTKPTTGGSQVATSPIGIQIPTRPVPTTATQAPTQRPTQAPTQKPTTGGSQSATQAPTQKPTTSQGATVAPTTATVAPTTPIGTVDPSAPTDPTGTVDPSAPTDPTGTVDPSAPTADPSAPTETTPVEPTEGEPTVAPTVESTEPEGTTPSDGNGGEEEPKDFPWIIIVIIAAAAVVAGGAVFFIIKKKKQG